MKNPTKFFVSIKDYFLVEDMKNEAAMWYVAGGLLMQFLFGVLKLKKGYSRRLPKDLEVLDICSGSGTFANYLSVFIPKIKVTCVDIDDGFLEFGRQNFRRWKFLKADATTFLFKKKYSVITISSGYHHIENAKKIDLLRNIKRHLAPEGIILMCDNFLPAYNNRSERRLVVKRYYNALRKYLRNENVRSQTISILSDVENQDLEERQEHKVSFQIFKQHLKASDLRIDQKIAVWKPFHSDEAGSYVLALKVT